MRNKKRQILTDKHGISIVIGYILLITISIAMSILVYQWLRTYVPKESPKCSEGTSILIKEISYDCTPGDESLSITVKNNGRFSINGYFIHASDKSGEELATIDLSQKIIVQSGEGIFLNSVEFSNLNKNNLLPSGTHPSIFDITDYCPCGVEGKTLTKIEIIPTRIQEIEGKNRFVSCSDAKVEEEIVCEVICEPDCTGRVCGIDPICGKSCPPGCTGSEVCNSLGQCIPPEQCTDTCATYGYQCGTWTICGVSTNCLPGCSAGYECNALGKCVSLCGNRIINSGEGCDDGNNVSGDGCSSSCTVESGFTCSGEPSVCQLCGNGIIEGTEQCDDGGTNSFDGCSSTCAIENGWTCTGQPSICIYSGGGAPSCTNYCLSLNLGYTSSSCPANSGQCTSQGGNPYGTGTGGYTECTNTGATGNYVCCCKPAV